MSELRLVVATGNPGKAREFGRLLGRGFAVEALPRGVRLPEESGDTFAENAVLKARTVFLGLGGDTAVLADDSGVSVTALGGRPGVWSARYAGQGAGDQANNRKLLDDLRGAADRSARFVCVLALVMPVSEDRGGRLLVAEGVLQGRILEEPRGSNGFGYDPLFQPEGWEVSLAEAAAEAKDAVSHRARAVAALHRRLAEEGVGVL